MMSRSVNRRSALVLVGCSLAMGLSAILAAAIQDLRLLAVSVAVAAFIAGFLLRQRGALTGFGSVLLVSSAWAFFVLARAWVEGDLAQTFPGCDPCGFVGHVGRMVIVTLMSLGTFGLLAAVAGGLGELVAASALRPVPAPTDATYVAASFMSMSPKLTGGLSMTHHRIILLPGVGLAILAGIVTFVASRQAAVAASDGAQGLSGSSVVLLLSIFVGVVVLGRLFRRRKGHSRWWWW